MSTTAFQAPSPESLSELLPQYGIESFIAQGGMGAVYKGRQLSLDRDVAIKVLPKELGCDVEFRESFITEAKAMARLNHPNLLGVFDYGDVDGMPYIVMEYVERGSLHQAAWNQVIDPKAAVAIVKGICDGLAHAHENGIIHRDIKPSNILLTKKVEPKVADFGLAHSTDSEESGMMMGTPGYTAPEVFHDPNQAGKLADIYSVGVILHQLLTGIDPAGSSGPPTHPTGNIRLDALWRKATNIHPSQRYASMAAMASDLDKWIGASKRAGLPTAAPAYSPQKQFTRPVKAAGVGSIFLKLIIIAVLGTAVYYTYQKLQDQKAKNEAIADSNDEDKGGNTAPPVQKIIRIEPPKITNHNTGGSGTPEKRVIPPVKKVVKPAEVYTPGDPELRERAIELIAKAREKRDKAFADNARAMAFQISASARAARPDEADSIRDMEKDIVDSHIPLTDDIHGLPPALSASFEHARSKEKSIIEEYRAELMKIRDAYVPRLLAAAEKEADGETKRNLLTQAERAKNLDNWIGLLSPEPKWVPNRSSRSFIGKWNQILPNGKSTTWIAHPGGRLVVADRKLDGTWEILNEGTLHVKLKGRPTFKYTADRSGWISRDRRAGSITREGAQ